ncbi:MAG: hypothetical protein NCW75_03320 [Phycisphaera sp.]|nr:MAG: hypothetical protein NCW75_03320 [Phycisphaera sp.]
MNDPEDGDYDAVQSTAPNIAVGELTAIVAGPHGIRLYDKSASVLDSRFWTGSLPYAGTNPITDPAFPFAPADMDAIGGTPRVLQHGQADYDPISERLWMLYSETWGFNPEIGINWQCVQQVHMAVSGDPDGFMPMDVLDTLSDEHWWYYTGNTTEGTDGNGGIAFDFKSGAINSFRGAPFDVNHRPTEDTIRFPSLGFDERAVIVAFSSHGLCAVDDVTPFQQFIYIIPREYQGPTGPVEFINGGRPTENDFISIRMLGRPIIEDVSVQAKIAQEPYEQYDNVTLMVSTDGTGSGTLQDSIRIKGLFFEPNPEVGPPRWEVRQRLEEVVSSPQGWEVLDMGLSSYGLEFFRPTSADDPAAAVFSPTVEEDMFTSAILTEDAAGNPRVFAVHAVLPDDGTGSADDHWVVQWYVIDPKVPDTDPISQGYEPFHDADILSEDWRPTIVDAGRIEVEGGHCYHPVLGVSTGGLMTIEYTYSSSTDEQEIRRARFNSSHAITSTTTLRTGPSGGYLGDRWALYADLQFDPNPATGAGACNWLWSTHTLVDEDATSSTFIRDVWLFRKASTPFCFQTDMNSNGFTEIDDMVMYNNLFLQEDARADTDADGVVDATDMANYLDAYDKATGP